MGEVGLILKNIIYYRKENEKLKRDRAAAKAEGDLVVHMGNLIIKQNKKVRQCRNEKCRKMKIAEGHD